MSQFNATIIDIQEHDSINIVTFEAEGFTLHMMSLELHESIKVGTGLVLGVKASSVAIAKEFSGALSYANQLDLQINEIQEGELLCSLQLKSKNFELESIITKASAKRMHLQVADSITALIKSSDLYIVEVL
ncbi:transporter [Sulfurimonas sp. SAG-AH-194-C21]|nr:transporter [Sulfurimonas sp. SAG-AH-194-C21]MDF1884032.1 transporter [Sulfurimonas sp. SAG-AH-194-C21]